MSSFKLDLRTNLCFSNTETFSSADRIGLRFEKEVVRAINLVTSLPDNEYKQDLLNVGI